MGYIKFSIIFALLVSSVFADSTRFTPKSCLEASYRMKMLQNGPLFGLLKQEFVIDKKNCIIHITYKKYLPKEWIIDVCREPVHIKVSSSTGVDVAKKVQGCAESEASKDTGNFCSQYSSLMNLIQDEGLIFAEGDRDNLNSDHGRTYCSYLLLRKYLYDSVIFSRYSDVPDIFIEAPKPQAPATQPVQDEKTEAEVTDSKTVTI